MRPPPVAGAPRFVGGVTRLRRLKERPLTETWRGMRRSGMRVGVRVGVRGEMRAGVVLWF